MGHSFVGARLPGSRFSFRPANEVAAQAAFLGINLARIQPATKGAEHSTAKSCNDVVNSRRVRLGQTALVDAAVLRKDTVHAEHHRLRIARQVRPPQPGLEALCEFCFSRCLFECVLTSGNDKRGNSASLVFGRQSSTRGEKAVKQKQQKHPVLGLVFLPVPKIGGMN